MAKDTDGAMTRYAGHKKEKPPTPISRSGKTLLTKCDEPKRATTIGYLGLNYPDKTCTKRDLIVLAAHPIILRGYLHIERAVEHFEKRIVVDNMLSWVECMRKIDSLVENIDALPESDSAQEVEELHELTGIDEEDAFQKLDEPEDLFPALLYHWSQHLQDLSEFVKGHIPQAEIAEIYAKLDDHLAKKNKLTSFNVSLPSEYRDVSAIHTWPHGLDHSNLEAHGETKIEIWNRLWQLYWFMRSDLFASENAKLFLPASLRTGKYTVDTAGSQMPMWWSTKTTIASDDISEQYHQSRATGGIIFGDRPEGSTLPSLPCVLVTVNRNADPNRFQSQIKPLRRSTESTFAEDDTPLRNPCPYTMQGEWRNVVRAELALQGFGLHIDSIHFVVMSADGTELESSNVFDVVQDIRAPQQDVIKLFRLNGAAQVQAHIWFTYADRFSDDDDMEELPFDHPTLAIREGEVITAPYTKPFVEGQPEDPMESSPPHSELVGVELALERYKCNTFWADDLNKLQRDVATNQTLVPAHKQQIIDKHCLDSSIFPCFEEEYLASASPAVEKVPTHDGKIAAKKVQERDTELAQEQATKIVELAVLNSATQHRRRDAKLDRKSSAFPGLGQWLTPQEVFASDEYNRSDEQIIEEEYSNIDPRTPEGHIQWCRLAISKLAPLSSDTRGPVGDMDPHDRHEFETELRKRRDYGVGPELDKDITEADGHLPPPISRTAPDDRDIESALTGTTGREGPGVDLCLELFEMKMSKNHRGTLKNYRSTGELGQIVKTDLLASQVTGIVHMLIRTLGKFPLSTRQQNNPKFAKILQDLKYECPPVQGGILEDAPGMGKTWTTLAFFSWYAMHAEHVDDHGNPDHRPTMIIVPDGYVCKQWILDINDLFPNIELIVANAAYGNMPPRKTREGKDATNRWNVVSAAMVNGRTDWPRKLQYIFDRTQLKASRTLMICSYNAWRHRVINRVDLTKSEVEGIDDLPEWWVPKKKGDHMESLELSDAARDRWQGKFKMTLLDEGHIIRNPNTQTHWSVRHLEAPVNWILSATPIVNKAEDVAREARIFWPAAERLLRADHSWPEVQPRYSKAVTEGKPTIIWDWLSHADTTIGGIPIDSTSIWRLLFIQPYLLEALLKTRDLHLIAQYCKEFDVLISLRRSPTSRLPGFSKGEGGKLNLSSIITPHTTNTLSLYYDRSDRSRSEYDAWHRRATQEYSRIITEWAKQGKKKSNGRERPPPAVTNPLSKMAIATASTRLARLAYIMSDCCKDGNTRVETIKKWRDNHFGVDMVLDLTTAKVEFDDDNLKKRPSRIDRLKLLVEGSPKLVETFRLIRKHVLPLEFSPVGPPKPLRFRKLLITEEFPLIAWYWELILNTLHIPTQVLHSDLSDEERTKVVDDFITAPDDRDPSHLTICILMYTINANGVNLDKDCHVCIVNTAAANSSLELQACCRIIRVSQPYNVRVYRLCVVNSHDEWRDAVQANKALFDAATKAYSDDALEVCCRMLNTFGVEEEKRILDSELGKRCMDLLRLHKTGKMFSHDPLYSVIQQMAAVTQIQRLPFDVNRPVGDTKKQQLSEPLVADSAEEDNENEDEDDVEDEKDMDDDGNTDIRSDESNDGGVNIQQYDGGNSEGESESDPTDSGDDKDDDFEPGRDQSDQDDFEEPGKDPEILDINDPISNSSVKVEYWPAEKIVPTFFNTTEMTVWWRDYWSEYMGGVEKESFPQDLIYTLYICMLDPHGKCDWTPADLRKDALALERALRMLSRHRFGIQAPSLRVTPYINYESLKGKDGEELVRPFIYKERSEEERQRIKEKFGMTMVPLSPKARHGFPDLGPCVMAGYPFVTDLGKVPDADIEAYVEKRHRELPRMSELELLIDIAKNDDIKVPWAGPHEMSFFELDQPTEEDPVGHEGTAFDATAFGGVLDYLHN